MTDTATGSRAAANIAHLRRGYEAFQTGNLDLLRDELFAPDIAWHNPGRNILSGDYKGVEAVIAMFVKQFEETGGTFAVELHDVLGSEDHAVALGTATAERNGKSLSEPYAHVCHFEGDKLTEAWIMQFDPYKGDELFG